MMMIAGKKPSGIFHGLQARLQVVVSNLDEGETQKHDPAAYRELKAWGTRHTETPGIRAWTPFYVQSKALTT